VTDDPTVTVLGDVSEMVVRGLVKVVSVTEVDVEVVV
jgi:hypothetical protein